jgi:hypothetical protein
MSSLQIDKTNFHIKNELDYELVLAHGMIVTGFISDLRIMRRGSQTKKK